MTADVTVNPKTAELKSTNVVIEQKLGRKWHHVHSLTYAICLLGALHFVMLRKGFQLEPLIYLFIIMLLLLLRLIPARRKQNLSRKNTVQ